MKSISEKLKNNCNKYNLTAATLTAIYMIILMFYYHFIVTKALYGYLFVPKVIEQVCRLIVGN
jgi:hypothetical protein